jgi:hypothetical protein
LHRILVFLIVTAGVIGAARAQQDSPPPRFFLSGSLASTISDPYWWYSYAVDGMLVAGWSRSEAIELAYGPAASIIGMQIHGLVNIAYTKVATAESPILGGPGFGYATWERIPVILGIRFSAPTRCTPYVEFGAGAMRARFQEHVDESGVSSAYWTFIHEMGAGVEFKFTPIVKAFVFAKKVVGDVPPGERSRFFGKVNTPGSTDDTMRGFGAAIGL